MTGGRAVACDPLYALGTEAIRARLATAESAVRELLAREAGRFVWRTFADTEELVAARLAAAERFLADLERRRDEGRYLPHALPALPFPDGAFDLALCSHFLFLYSAALNSPSIAPR